MAVNRRTGALRWITRIDNHDDCVNVGGQCVDASCGDGYLHDGVEGCDDGNLSDTDDCLNNCSVATCGWIMGMN